MAKEDNEIIADILSGNEPAFGVLIERHIGSLYAFVYRYVRNSEDAKDIVQEGFVRAWRNLKKFDPSKSFKTWLFAIAKNAALDLLKKKRPAAFSELSDDDEVLDAMLAPYNDQEELPDELFDRVQAKAAIDRAVESLPQTYRTVLGMRYAKQLKFREIAKALGEPIDTVKSRHRRGLALLKEIIRGEGFGTQFA